MSHELAKNEKTHLAVAPKQPEHSTVELTEKERLYPVARLVHGMTKKENKENPNGAPFVQGDVVVYPQRQKLASLGGTFNVIFLRNTLEWANFEEINVGGKLREEWRSEEQRTNANEDLPLEYTHDGKKMKRYRQVTLFCLLPSAAEAFLKDLESDSPISTGFVTPIAIKVRNFSAKMARQILDTVGGNDFVAKNKARVARGFEPIPVYAYEHVISTEDYTNKAGNTFPVLAFKKVIAVQNKEVLKIAADAHAMISQATSLKTVQVDEDPETATVKSRGEVSDEV